jgi:hypothetical protein
MGAHHSLKDILSGLIFIAFGLAFGYASLSYDLGTTLRMGPGYFPLVLSGLVVLLGALTLFKAFTAGADETPVGPMPWLGLVLLVGALFFFGFTVRGLGLVPALLITVFMSAFASRHNGIVAAAVIALGMTVLCVLIFVYALGLPLRLVGPWLAV